jgi:hypothetical protein
MIWVAIIMSGLVQLLVTYLLLDSIPPDPSSRRFLKTAGMAIALPHARVDSPGVGG